MRSDIDVNNHRACLVVAATAAVLLAGCGPTDDNAVDGVEPTPSPTEDMAGEEPDVDGDAAAGGTQPAVVALSFDGQGVPIATACNGVDGAVLATTEGEVTMTLVREGEPALRYNGEGMTAETSDVTVEEIGESTVYSATLQSDQVPPVHVTFEITDTSVLQDCPGP